MSNDLHKTHALAVLSILHAAQVVMDSLPDDEREKLNRAIDGKTAKLALVVESDGQHVHVEFAAVDAAHRSGFEKPLLSVDGPVTSPAMPPEAAQFINRAKLN